MTVCFVLVFSLLSAPPFSYFHFSFLSDGDVLNEQDHSGGGDEPDGMMSSLAKSKGARIGFFCFFFFFALLAPGALVALGSLELEHL